MVLSPSVVGQAAATVLDLGKVAISSFVSAKSFSCPDCSIRCPDVSLACPACEPGADVSIHISVATGGGILVGIVLGWLLGRASGRPAPRGVWGARIAAERP